MTESPFIDNRVTPWTGRSKVLRTLEKQNRPRSRRTHVSSDFHVLGEGVFGSWLLTTLMFVGPREQKCSLLILRAQDDRGS